MLMRNYRCDATALSANSNQNQSKPTKLNPIFQPQHTHFPANTTKRRHSEKENKEHSKALRQQSQPKLE
jgi:hypothetical protein